MVFKMLRLCRQRAIWAASLRAGSLREQRPCVHARSNLTNCRTWRRGRGYRIDGVAVPEVVSMMLTAVSRSGHSTENNSAFRLVDFSIFREFGNFKEPRDCKTHCRARKPFSLSARHHKSGRRESLQSTQFVQLKCQAL